MNGIMRQLNFVAISVAGVVLPLLRPCSLLLLGVAGAMLSLAIGGATLTALAIAAPFAGVALIGLWWEWHNRRRGPPPPAVIHVRLWKDEDEEGGAK